MYKVISGFDELEALIMTLDRYEYVAYDTETTGLNVRKDKIIGISFTYEVGSGFYLPLYRWSGSSLEQVFKKEDAIALLKKLQTKKLLMFNASFDVQMTKSNFDIDLLDALHCDVMLLKHTCDEERPFALKEISEKIGDKLGLGDTAKDEQKAMVESIKANGGSVTKESYELYKADMSLIGVYAAKDTDLTYRLYNYYMPMLEAEKLVDFFYKDEVMPLLKLVTIPMEAGGVKLDLEKMSKAKIDIEKSILELEEEIQKEIEPHLGLFTKWFLNNELPPRRSGEFAQYICKYAELKLPRTKSGRYSIGKEHLEKHERNKYVDFLQGGEYLLEEEVLNIQKLWWNDQNIKYMFNISSKFHLAKLFFDTLGEQSITKTEKGNPQMNELFLDSVKDKYHFAKLIVHFNKLNKIKSTYIDRFLDAQEDGIFYPRFMQHRTISGRYGGDLQQLNRPMEHEPEEKWEKEVFTFNNMIREFFISGDGRKFLDSDYSSLEVVVFSHVSGDSGLKDVFRNNLDFYSSVAIKVFNVEGLSADKNSPNYLGKVRKDLRQRAKAIALAIPYGATDYLLHKTLNIGQNEAKKLIDDYLNSYPKLKEWMHGCEELCKNKGIARSEAGRVRHMLKAPKIWYAHKEYILDSLELWKRFNDKKTKYEQMKFLRKEMVNYLNNSKNFVIQSLAASIVNRACIAMSKEFKRLKLNCRIVCQVHDQVIVECLDSDVVTVKKLMKYMMENTYKLSIPLNADPAVSNNFKDGH